jgi:hypothetical protein
MTDLVLQNFKEFSGKSLMHALANEKKKMFGEQKFHVKRRGSDCFCSSSLAGSFAKVRKARTSRCSIP